MKNKILLFLLILTISFRSFGQEEKIAAAAMRGKKITLAGTVLFKNSNPSLLDKGKCVPTCDANECTRIYPTVAKHHGFGKTVHFNISLRKTMKITISEVFDSPGLLDWLAEVAKIDGNNPMHQSDSNYKPGDSVFINVEFGVYTQTYVKKHRSYDTAYINRIAIFLVPCYLDTIVDGKATYKPMYIPPVSDNKDPLATNPLDPMDPMAFDLGDLVP